MQSMLRPEDSLEMGQFHPDQSDTIGAVMLKVIG
jgi:imidazoleglycerol phosphate synthase glutamine amidotransferase subunit HisH